MISDPNTLTKQQIQAAFRRHYGAASQLARELEILPQNVTDFLRGRGRSKRVETAVRVRAAALINAERERKDETNAA